MISLYFDEDSMDQDLVSGLRARNMDLTTASEENMIRRNDNDHLALATQQSRVLFTFNRGDFYKLHCEYLAQGKHHAGMIVANQQQYPVGEVMRRILHLAAAKTSDDMKNRIEFLSAWG